MSGIIIDKVTFSNFRSYGKKPTSIEFKEGIDLVVGVNGQGKTSAFVHSLAYAFYGVGVYGENLNDLKNRFVPDEAMFVEVSFIKGKKTYRIKRGRPKLLEIYEDNEKLSFGSDKLAEEFIQQTLLNGLTLNSFNSLFVVQTGNPAFSIFRMSKPERRAMIEQLFDLSEFSKINSVAKKELEETRSAYALFNESKNKKAIALNSMIEKSKAYELALKEYNQNRDNQIREIESQIDAIKAKNYDKIKLGKLSREQEQRNEALQAINTEIKLRLASKEQRDRLTAQLGTVDEKLNSLNQNQTEYDKLIDEKSKLRDEILAKKSGAQGEIKAFASVKDKIISASSACDRVCPIVSNLENMGKIATDETLDIQIETLNKEISSLRETSSSVKRLLTEKDTLTKQLANIRKDDETIDCSLKAALENEIFKNKSVIDDAMKDLATLEVKEKSLEILKNQPKPIAPFDQKDFDEANKEFGELEDKLANIMKKGKALAELHEFLKKDHIRNFVVKTAFPPLRKAINKILALFFDENVKIAFDNDLDPVIYRGGAVTPYSSFSGGEKKRLDLAFLFSVREFLLTKASISMNVLIMDELLDSELDDAGINAVFEYLNGLKNTDIVLITHKIKNREANRVFEISRDKKYSEITLKN